MPSPNPRAADPVALLLLAVWLLAAAMRPLVAAAIALVLTAAGWRPSPAPVIPRSGDPAPLDQGMPSPLVLLPVVELRRLARAAGHRQLARSGRRVDLLAALGAV